MRQVRQSKKTPGPPKIEFVVQGNGQVRQAGATQADGEMVQTFRRRAESELWVFSYGVIDQHWLYPPLHQEVCTWLQRIPPYRKCLVMPRGHAKSTLVGQALPLHMIVQPADANIYFPGLAGTDTRILMCGEKVERSEDHLRVVQSTAETNGLLRGFWPHTAWENPKRESKAWNDKELIFPRAREWPDPTLRAIGVGGAITGAHPNCLIKDDITTEAAANSPVLMQTAIRWHENVRALLSNQATDLEFITGTRWAPADLIEHIETADGTVEVNQEWRELVTPDGQMLYPTTGNGAVKFGAPGMIEFLRKQHGSMFWLLYMNSVGNSDLVDFAAGDLREYEIQNGKIVINEDDRDTSLAARMNAPAPNLSRPDLPNGGRGMLLKDVMAWEEQNPTPKRERTFLNQPPTGRLDRDRLDYIRAARRGTR